MHTPVDHVFRYYEPEHSYFKVQIPPFLQLNQKKLEVKVSKINAQVIFEPHTSEIHVQSKTQEAMNVCEMTVFVYSDQWCTDVLAVCRIEVTPLTCMYSQTKAGVQNNMSLSFPANESKTIELYSSCPENVYFMKGKKKFQVFPNTINYFSVLTKTF